MTGPEPGAGAEPDEPHPRSPGAGDPGAWRDEAERPWPDAMDATDPHILARGRWATVSWCGPMAVHLHNALGDGPATVAELAARFGDEAGEDSQRVKEDSIRAALRRGLREERFTADGPPKAQRWALR